MRWRTRGFMTNPRSHRPLLDTRMNRRRALASGAALASSLAVIAAIGCGRDGATAKPRRGGTLRTATSLPLAAGLDPQIENATGLQIFPRIYGYALHIDPRGDVLILDHAEGVEQPDELTTIIRLRQDVRFQDIPPVRGRAVTAHDLARSVERYRSNVLATQKTWHETVLDRVETPDDRTLRVITRRPYAYTLHALGDIAAGAIIPSELVEQQADLSFRGVGSGPFMIESATLTDVALRRNEGYFRRNFPLLDAMTWHVFDTDAAKLAALVAGTAELAPLRNVAEADEVRVAAGGLVVDETPSLAYVSLGMRCDRPPFTDARVRRAIDLALGRDDLIGTLLPRSGAALGPVNPHLADGFWSLDAATVRAASGAMQTRNARLAEARALLTAAAQPQAFALRVADVPELLDLASVVRGMLADVGMFVLIDRMDKLNWFTAYHRGDFDVILISQPPFESPDIPTRLYHSGGPDGTTSPFGFADPAIDALVERSWGEADRHQRRATLLDAQRLMLEARPVLPLFTSRGYTARSPRVRDAHPELPGSLAQYNYAQWLAEASD
jgi:peptide/nickel transport system substrate-binding protein